MDGEDGPGVQFPCLAANEAAWVAAPGCAGPSGALMEELRVRAQSGGDAGIVGVLDFDRVALSDHPACNEVVIVGIEWTDTAKEGVFFCEALDKGFILQDFRAVGRRASGHDKDTSVDIVCGCYLKVVTF